MEQVGSAYAAALVETAQAKGSLDAVHADVDTLQVRIGEGRKEERGISAAAACRRRLAKVADCRQLLSLLLLSLSSSNPPFSWCTGVRNGRSCASESWIGTSEEGRARSAIRNRWQLGKRRREEEVEEERMPLSLLPRSAPPSLALALAPPHVEDTDNTHASQLANEKRPP